jgi:CheY-like chemotaxis protein
VGSASAALELVDRDDFDLILLDLGLPDMDGYEACRRIRMETAARPGGEVPIAAMTARAESGLRASCAAAGMIDCLAKPIDTAALARLLDRIAAMVREFGPRAAASVQPSQIAASDRGAPPRPTPPGTPLIDIPALLERLDGDELFMRELLGIFVEEAPGRRAAFEKAAASGDIGTLQKLGHGLKGSSLSLCAGPLGASAGALEAFCLRSRQNDGSDTVAISALEAILEEIYGLLEGTADIAQTELGKAS